MEVKGFGVNVMLVAPGAITSGFGKKQADSFDMPSSTSFLRPLSLAHSRSSLALKDSLYQSVRPLLEARATASQDPSHSLPAASLASGIVARALLPKPASYYTAGGKSLVFWVLSLLPTWVAQWALARKLGTDQVRRLKLQ